MLRPLQTAPFSSATLAEFYRFALLLTGNPSSAERVMAETLVDADLARESARLQAFQVQQQLSIQTLSIANGNPRALLGLFAGR